jgi:hypothetical protein
MRMLSVRFTVGRIMLAVLAIALGMAAMRFASEPLAEVVSFVTLVSLGFAVLAAAYRRGAARAFWAGFALFGGGYSALAPGVWWQDSELNGDPARRVLTSRVLDRLYPIIHERRVAGWLSRKLAHPRGGVEVQTQEVLVTLDRPIPMHFQGVALGAALDSVKAATRSPELPSGLPLYLDPIGLAEAEKTRSSAVWLDLDGVPLRRTLKHLLNQLDMTYRVGDGMILITSQSSYDGPPDPVFERPEESFRRVGHSGFALLIGVIGGLAGRLLEATRDRTP